MRFVALSFSAGAYVVGALLFPHDVQFLYLALIALIVAIFQFHRSRIVFMVSLMAAFVFLGAARPADSDAEVLETSSHHNSVVLFSVSLPEKYKSGMRCIMEISSDDTVFVAMVYLNGADRFSLAPHQYYAVQELKLHPLPFNTNPMAFDYGEWLKKRGIQAIAYLHADELLSLEIGDGKHQSSFLEFRWAMISHLFSKLEGGASEELLPALLLGYRSAVEQETRQDFMSSGVVHVLAVSGLHIGLMYALFNFLLRRLKFIPQTVSTILILSGIWLFALLSGLSLSVIRAALMFSIPLLLPGSRRGMDAFVLAVCGMLFYQPKWLLEVGFQLSALAVFGILQTAHWDQLLGGIARKLWTGARVSIAAQWFTLPVIIMVFRQFPVYFLLGNLFLLPLVSSLMYLGVLFIFPLPEYLISQLRRLTDFLSNLVIDGSSVIASMPVAVIKLGAVSVTLMTVSAIGWLLWTLLILSKQNRFLSMLAISWSLITLIFWLGPSVEKQIVTFHQHPSAFLLSYKEEDSLCVLTDSGLSEYDIESRVYPNEGNRFTIEKKRGLLNLGDEIILIDPVREYEALSSYVDWHLTFHGNPKRPVAINVGSRDTIHLNHRYISLTQPAKRP